MRDPQAIRDGKEPGPSQLLPLGVPGMSVRSVEQRQALSILTVPLSPNAHLSSCTFR